MIHNYESSDSIPYGYFYIAFFNFSFQVRAASKLNSLGNNLADLKKKITRIKIFFFFHHMIKKKL